MGTDATQVVSWDRDRWVALADRMLTAARPYASPGHGRITFPGAEGGYGNAVDGLEGFARTFLLAGFRIAGERGADPNNYAEWYAEGIKTGTDPTAPDRWVALQEHPQAKVEAASTALILDLTRPWIWDRLDSAVQERVIEYFSSCIGDLDYPPTNWCWFRLVVQTFLRSVGGPFSLDDMRQDLALHDSFQRTGGWLADGPERSYDHYNGWALQLYPTLWARMQGAEDLAAERSAHDRAVLDRFLQDAVHLVGPDGPLVQGRSLTYRFAAAAPYWVGAIAQVPSVPLGQLRRAASCVVDSFVRNGAPDEQGILTIGWHQPWRQIAQSYSGPSSPYWASKGMLGVSLPADHPVWSAPDVPLPVEAGDFLRAIAAPVWVVSGTKADAIVRVTNHGTDHALPGDQVGDSPLYARIGYSTATAPLLDDASLRQPTEGFVALVDQAGEVTHRAGWAALGVRIDGGSGGGAAAVSTDASAQVGLGAAKVSAHWIAMPNEQTLHGSGWRGEVRAAGVLTQVSLVRGPWEIRLARVERLAEGVRPNDLKLRFAGYPVVASDGLCSTITPLLGGGSARFVERPNTSPLGSPSSVPVLDQTVTLGAWAGVLVTLARTSCAGSAVAQTCESATSDSDKAQVTVDARGYANATWPDGVATVTLLPIHQ